MRRCFLSCIACTLIFILVLTSCSGPYLEISIKLGSAPLTVSIPATIAGKVNEYLQIPATVTGDTGPYTYTWYFARKTDTEWQTSGDSDSIYNPAFSEANTWQCRVRITDKNGKTADSNICTISITK